MQNRPHRHGGGAPSLLFIGYRSSFPGQKRPGHEVDHSISPSADIKNGWNCTSNPPACFHDVDRDIFAMYMPSVGAWGSVVVKVLRY
jgi:hypothetical protein